MLEKENDESKHVEGNSLFSCRVYAFCMCLITITLITIANLVSLFFGLCIYTGKLTSGHTQSEFYTVAFHGNTDYDHLH